MNYSNLITAHSSAFESVNTHELKQGDIIRSHGMVLVIGEKQISDKGSHADNGYGCAHYHLSAIVASSSGMPQPGSRLWNVQGNKLAFWERFKG